MSNWETTILISYSWWSLASVFVVSLLASATLYYKNKNNKLSKPLTSILFFIRFTATALISFLLLSPYIRYTNKILTKPLVVLGIDNSESMVLSKDSSFLKNEFKSKMNNFVVEASQYADIETFLFDHNIIAGNTPDFTGYRSDYGAFLNFFKENWPESAADYLVIVGDGIYNSGSNPDYIAENISTPIIVIATGDTLKKSDVAIKEVRFNKSAFIEDVSPVEISIEANGLNNNSLNVKVMGFGKNLTTKTITINSNNYTHTFTVPIHLTNPGKQRIEVIAEALPGESTLSNNTFVFYLDVLETKKKIIIIAQSPHPDISAIKQSLQKVRSYDVKVAFSSDLNKKIQEYDLAILHQLPGKDAASYEIVKQLTMSKTPVLFIMGNQTHIPSFNQTYPGVNLLSASKQTSYATNRINPAFNLFTFSEEESELFKQFPPVNVVLASFQTNPTSHTLSFQNIDNFETDFSLINYYQSPEKKLAAILGDGIWRWRMDNYLKKGNYHVFDEFLRKSVQYLLTTDKRKRFEVKSAESYTSNEPVSLEAMYYNASFEPVTSIEIPIQITDPNGNQFEYLFSPENGSYNLLIRGLSEGLYHYKSSIYIDETRTTEAGEFVVSNQSKELQNSQADHASLFQLSNKTKGNFLYINDLEKLTEILTHDNLKPKILYEQELIEMGSLPIYIMIVLALLSLEWFIRKFYGTY